MLQGYSSVSQALLGTFFTWALTAAGAALVFIFSSGQVSRFVSGGSRGPLVSFETRPFPQSTGIGHTGRHWNASVFQLPCFPCFLTRPGNRHPLVVHKPGIVFPSPASGTQIQQGEGVRD